MTARRALRVAAAAVVVALGLTSCSAAQEPAGSAALDAAQQPDGTVDALPTASIADVGPMRLADDLAAPTNHWFSGLVFGAQPQPVFPFPLAFATDGSSFTVDKPDVVVTERTIAAPFSAGLTIDLAADSFEVVRYDSVSVTLRYSDADGVIGDLTIAEGSPVVAFTAARETRLRPNTSMRQASEGVWELSADDTDFGVVAPGASVDDQGLTVSANQSAQWFAVPADSTIGAWADALGDPASSVSIEYEVAGDEARTRLTYEGTEASVVVAFPVHEPAQECDLGTFETAYGPAAACSGTVLEWAVPRVQERAGYDLDSVSDDTRSAITASLQADLAAIPAGAADTYFGGKGLARLATQLSIAQSMGDESLVTVAADELTAQLKPWVESAGCEQRDERCFVYDERLRMVVGQAPSFGSEEGNDHHFHYGYFLYAAAVLAEARPESSDRLAPVMDALASDIAAGTADGTLPTLRVFDPYRGHSWASGLSPFADGNNQESSSEAVAAWNGLALWADVRGDAALALQAQWMLSAEAASALSLWLEPDLDFADGYDHGIVSLNWGGKRDYATWFSPEPSAILGIQVIPAGPVSLEYLGRSPDRVAANVDEAGGASAFSGPLGDQILMYSALADPKALADARSAAAELADDELDDGNSRSGMLAWFAAVEAAQNG